jgi:excinuclease ABC subunit C
VNKILNTIKNFPGKPGVYQFINAQAEVIYVGKAKNLKNRVSSYFNKKTYDSAKLRVLVSKIADIRYTLVESESDALLLENNLIKRLQPKYNVLLKDDKTYPWICIKNEPFPRVFSTRRIVNDGSQYFGPFTSGVYMKALLDLIRQLFPLRNCNLPLTSENIQQGKFKSCLEYQLGNCMAPCVLKQTEDDYKANIHLIINILNGNSIQVIKVLKDKMNEYASIYMFEKAQTIKNKIDLLGKYQSKSTIVNQSLNNLDVFSLIDAGPFACVNFLKVVNGSIIQSHNLELKKGLEEGPEELLGIAISDIRSRLGSKSKELIVPVLPDFKLSECKYTIPQKGDKFKLLELSLRNCKEFLLERQLAYDSQKSASPVQRILTTMKSDFRLSSLPIHIECFDNSNLQGTNPVAACVVFRNAKPAKRDYRHFNIKTVEGPDDYASMYEVVFRRYSRIIEEQGSIPQLVVVDGGKGQLGAAYKALVDLNLENKIAIIGIAKRLEEIFFPNDSVPLYLDKNSESLKVIQAARNEAHRFGISFHRNKRSKNSLKSELSDIEGVGEKTIENLFKKMGSVEAIQKSSIDELTLAVGKKRAEIVFNYFNNNNPDHQDL